MKSIICDTWNLAVIADPDQIPQNEASDQALYRLRKLQGVTSYMKQSQVPVQDHFLCLHSETIDKLVLSVL